MPATTPPDDHPDAAAEPALKGSYLQSLEKGMAVLGAFRGGRPLLPAAEIAERAGLDRASTRRVLLTLVQLGYVQQFGRQFGLTPKVLDFGYQYLAGLPFWAVAHPVLEELSDQLDETVSIGVLEGRDVMFVLRVPAKRLITFDPSIGSRVPAHLHSIGHVLLAAMPVADATAFAAAVDFRPLTEHSITGAAPLLEHLAAARQQAWALTARQYEQDYGGISVPLQDAAGRVVAGLNVSFIVDRDAELRAVNDILPRLKIAARRIQQSSPPPAGHRRGR